MQYAIEKSIAVLERTPATLSCLLSGLPEDWVLHNEGGDTWNVYDVIGHLVHGEETDWMTRTILIMSDNIDKHFIPFNRFAQFETSNGKSLQQLLDEFKDRRATNIAQLRQLHITAADLHRTGIHPAFGEVSLSQLLATWVVHDLDHIAQIARVMAKQYKDAVGPWVEYLKILRQ